jgi:uncharacterized radical SAM superfamily Fe-S cluster-containing enzyme
MIKLLKRKFYWLTLLYHNRRGYFFKRGSVAMINTTTRCPLHCDYCPMFYYGPVKKYDECSFDEWKNFIERFPQWISQMYISGGEPSLYKDIVPLVNWLVGRGHHVIVFTNLWKIENYKGIKPHWRLIFQPTFHNDEDKLERFLPALREMEKTYQVISQQIFENPNGLTRIKEFFSRDWFKNDDHWFQFAPDTPRTQRVWLGCIEMYRADK